MSYYEDPPVEQALSFPGDRLADPLTGLPTAALFRDRIKHGLQVTARRGEKMVVVLLDYSNFNAIAHKLTPMQRPVLVKEAATALKAAVRGADTVARITKDTFGLVLFVDSSYYEAVQAVRRISEAIRTSIRREGEVATPKLGVAIAPQDGVTADNLIEGALKALAACHLLSKDSLVSFASVDLRSQASNLESEASRLRQALHDGSMFMLYQPRIRLEDWSINGLEALLRWRFPDNRELEAHNFFAAATDAGVDVELSWFALNQACREASSLLQRNQALNYAIAVNVTTRQFFRKDLVAQVTSALELGGLTPSHLELEIPEAAILVSRSKSQAILTALKNLGVNITVDEFGMGSLNFRSLKGLPIKRVKLSSSLSRESDSQLRKLAESLLFGARRENIISCAKAVETMETANWLKDEGCEELQGVVYSKPVKITDLPPR